MGSIYASFVIFESLTLRKEKRTICLSEFTQASKSLFFSLNKVPAAACWVFEVGLP